MVHEFLYHTMELGALEMQSHAALANAFLAGAERTEVLGSLWCDVGAQLRLG